MPEVMRQPFVLPRPITFEFAYMNSALIGGFLGGYVLVERQYTPRMSEKLSVRAVI